MPPTITTSPRIAPPLLALLVALTLALTTGCGGLAWVDHGRRRPSGPSPDLVYAASQGDVAAVRRLLASGKESLTLTSTGHAALHAAAARGHLEILELLIAAKAPLDQRASRHELSPLHVALLNGRVEAARRLLKAGASPTLRDKRGRSPLLLATYVGDLRLVKALAAKERPCARGWCPLHVAAAAGYSEVLAALLAAKHPVDPKTAKEGWTPLFVAASAGRAPLVAALVQAGADVHHATAAGRTALHGAARRGSVASIEALLKAGATVRPRAARPTKNAKTPLLEAIEARQPLATATLLAGGATLPPTVVAPKEPALNAALARYRHGDRAVALGELRAMRRAKRPGRRARFDMEMVSISHSDHQRLRRLLTRLLTEVDVVDRRYYRGFTALWHACELRSWLWVKLLLRFGANPELQGGEGEFRKAPLHEAVLRGDPRIPQLLLDHGADVNVRDARDATPLYWAVHVKRRAMVSLLLAAKARIDLADDRGKTPCDVASGALRRLLGACPRR